MYLHRAYTVCRPYFETSFVI
ncbi:hypothetical protein [Veillonella sp.]|nr:hypothetical protein [Veillonella sp.]